MTSSEARQGTPLPDLASTQDLMRKGDFAAALKRTNQALGIQADEPEWLYTHAVCLRYLGRPAEALATLELLREQQPSHGRAQQELGYVYLALGNRQAALSAFQQASRLNGALLASFEQQALLLNGMNRREAAAQLTAHVQHLKSLPPLILTAMDLIAQGKLVKAETLCRKILQKAPKNVEAMRLLADIGIRLGILEDAEFLLESALEFKPDHVAARIEYIQALRKSQKYSEALEQAKTLLTSAPDNPQFRSLVSIEQLQAGDFEQAIAGFDEVLQRLPGEPITLTSRGHALKTCGRTDEAIASYRSAIASHAGHGEAYYSLANLKTYAFSPDEIEQMLSLAKDLTLGPNDRAYLAFALGKAFEDQKDYAAAFAHYERGNRLKKSQSRYRREKMTVELAAQKQHCTPALFDQHQGQGCQDPDPIFILGMPRAGSTLLEQILASHSQIDGTMELPNILALANRLRRGDAITAESRYPAVLHDLSADEIAQLGQRYIDDTRTHRGSAPYFIDKMPNNFRHIGLIKLILPNAKIIDARRHPMACCFSMFKQLFAEGQEFSYDLNDAGTYYHDYVSLMDHWDQVLPGTVLRVHHERVVENLEKEVRRILDFCGLPFEQACVEYHKNTRAVRTPSSEQVRQPIFTDALEQWHNFEPYLSPLKQALGVEVLSEYPVDQQG